MKAITKKPKLVPFDAARYLTDDATIAQYMSIVLESGDSDHLLLALGDVARARGMEQVAQAAGLGWEPSPSQRAEPHDRRHLHLHRGFMVVQDTEGGLHQDEKVNVLQFTDKQYERIVSFHAKPQ